MSSPQAKTDPPLSRRRKPLHLQRRDSSLMMRDADVVAEGFPKVTKNRGLLDEGRLIYAGRQEVQQVDEARSLDTKASEDESKALAMELMKGKAKTWLKLKVR
ncbi:unnamed protein product [Vicia faba]|uniref:Uncharacterized protein n=1 Tax=Vicia faba TaxID=3906 RepID=A0AAV1AMZ9_VICFA|nr:unnamed protein product [Vicia faba]